MAPKKRPPTDEGDSSTPKKARTESSATSPAGSSTADVLNLHSLFDGAHGAAWEVPIRKVLESLPEAAKFIGPHRDKGIVPVRELTFQALKPNPPGSWRVVAFGQNPYPRMESATGIAMFDNAFDAWADKRFGSVSSMRNIIKCAAMVKYKAAFTISPDGLRAILKEHSTVSPPEWFQSMLAQGVLLLNASLTTGGSGITTAKHATFWKPVIETVVDEILQAKKKSKSGIVFAWWGGQAQLVKKSLQTVFDKYASDVAVRHIDHFNPAAQGDLFCTAKESKELHFAHLNTVLMELKLPEVDWLPGAASISGTNAAAMGDFITETKKLHKMYLDRLQGGLEKVGQLAPVEGIMASKLVSLVEACAPLGLEGAARASLKAMEKVKIGKLSQDLAAAVHLYTGDALYKQLNEILRNADRKLLQKFFPYLRLLLEAFGKLTPEGIPLYRGILKDLAKEYPEGSIVTWWSVSSCTPNLDIAKSFGGGKKGGTLFRVKSATAVPIMNLSAFKGEEEYVLAPGTQLKVTKISRGEGAVEIVLEEKCGARLVS